MAHQPASSVCVKLSTASQIAATPANTKKNQSRATPGSSEGRATRSGGSLRSGDRARIEGSPVRTHARLMSGNYSPAWSPSADAPRTNGTERTLGRRPRPSDAHPHGRRRERTPDLTIEGSSDAHGGGGGI